LRDHPKSLEFLEYYTIRGTSGAHDLKFNMNLINPAHIMGSISLTYAQKGIEYCLKSLKNQIFEWFLWDAYTHLNFKYLLSIYLDGNLYLK